MIGVKYPLPGKTVTGDEISELPVLSPGMDNDQLFSLNGEETWTRRHVSRLYYSGFLPLYDESGIARRENPLVCPGRWGRVEC